MPELARSFGQIAADYDAARPEYAPEAVARVVDLLGLDRSSRVLDLAAGSGTLTRALATHLDDLVAVEPDDEMRAVLETRSPGLEVLAGSAEAIPVPDASVDAVFIGDAFHWFDGAVAVDELARVLRPGGGVALLWNHWWSDGDDRTSNSLDPPLPAQAQEVFDELYVRSGRAAARETMADPLLAFSDPRFELLAEEEFSRSKLLTRQQVVDLFTTTSSIASLAPGERDEVKRTLLPLLDPSYRLTIITSVHWTRRV